MIFVVFAVWELYFVLFWGAGIGGEEIIAILLIIAVSISFFRAFIVFLAYFLAVGTAFTIGIVVFLSAIGVNYLDIVLYNSNKFLSVWEGALILTIGSSVYLTKRKIDKENERERKYRPPSPDDFKEREAPKERVVVKEVVKIKEVPQELTRGELGRVMNYWQQKFNEAPEGSKVREEANRKLREYTEKFNEAKEEVKR
jgi:hypothetical protein